ncbi:alpha/beta fold hydrolase [Aquimarina sp. D1M17]|uniref:alpha/beta fold hydrolase n=1 Tax=Aquimarina acroporae TaxID=2937283 RepID=UPI0020BE4EA3|nr:alpha/beta fold hydrolase [Aquimarina acroporae]MCK8521030.1 alpha/beta fold hydrolase [Aquimarina acroporae]
MKPETKYAKSKDINIAYQVFGSGVIDLVYIPGWISNIDLMWLCPELVNFFNELGKFARVILFDKRGTGLSDRVVEFATLEERMEDITAVMEAVGSKKAALFGHSEGGSVSALFSATYPDRVLSLITFGIFAKRRYSDDYPWAPTDQERQKVYDMIENNWGSGVMNLKSLAPSKANSPAFMEWLANYFRSGASPKAAMKLTKMNTQVDIIDILSSIKVPTLLMQRTNDIDVKIQEGRFIADCIQGSKFVELEGDDHLFWIGNTHTILKEIKNFIQSIDTKLEPVYDKKLYTFMVVYIHNKEPEILNTKKRIKKFVNRYNGNLVFEDKSSFVITFEGPSKAVNCSTGLIEEAKDINVQISVGIDVKECSIKDNIYEDTKDFVLLIKNQSIPNQIILTQTVKNLLVGMPLNFIPSKIMFKTELGTSLLLFVISQKSKLGGNTIEVTRPERLQQDSFLQKVIQNINNHLSNDYYGVAMLCKEIGMSERQLQRKLKVITNKSPNQLIAYVRLHKAKELLISKQSTIAEIAFQTGFSCPSYFSKCFKKEFDVSPSALVHC